MTDIFLKNRCKSYGGDYGSVDSNFPSDERVNELIEELKKRGYEVVRDEERYVRPDSFCWLVGSKSFPPESFVQNVVNLIEADSYPEEYLCQMRNVTKRVIVHYDKSQVDGFDVCVVTYSHPADIKNGLEACGVPAEISSEILDRKVSAEIDCRHTLMHAVQDIFTNVQRKVDTVASENVEKNLAEMLKLLDMNWNKLTNFHKEKFKLDIAGPVLVKINLYGDYYQIDTTPSGTCE